MKKECKPSLLLQWNLRLRTIMILKESMQEKIMCSGYGTIYLSFSKQEDQGLNSVSNFNITSKKCFTFLTVWRNSNCVFSVMISVSILWALKIFYKSIALWKLT